MIRKCIGFGYLVVFGVAGLGGATMDLSKRRFLLGVLGLGVTAMLSLAICVWSMRRRASVLEKLGWWFPLVAALYFAASVLWDVFHDTRAFDVVVFSATVAIILPSLIIAVVVGIRRPGWYAAGIGK